MPCSIQIGDVQASGSIGSFGGYSSVDIEFSVQQCNNLQVTVYAGPNAIGQTTVITPNGTSTHNIALTKEVRCDENIRVEVVCLDSPDCRAVSQTAVLCSFTGCCVPISINWQDLGCVGTTADRRIEFTFSGNVSDPGCLPYVLQLDFGDGQLGMMHPISAIGPFSFTETHDYDTTTTTNFTASVQFGLQPNCPPQEVQLSFDNCLTDCCPAITNTNVVINDCEPGCKRTATIEVEYVTFQSPCPPATLEWEIHDKNGTFVDDGGAISTGVPGPDSYTTLPLDPDGSPYTATLKTLYPNGCDDHVVTFDVPPCAENPKCPENLGVTATQGDCEHLDQNDPNSPIGRRVEISVSGDFFVGCGLTQTPTELLFDFGDGQIESHTMPNVSGSLTFAFDHMYAVFGARTITVSVVFPTGCAETAQFTLDVEKCAQNEPPRPPCPDPPPDRCVLCSWCHYAIKLGGVPARCKGWLLLVGALLMGYALFSILQGWVSVNLSDPWYEILGAATSGLTVAIITYFALRCGACCTLCLIRCAIVVLVLFVIAALIANIFVPGTFPFAGVVSFFWTMLGVVIAYMIAIEPCQKESAEYQEFLDNCE